MNTIDDSVQGEKPKSICDLSDQELIEKCQEWVSKLCKSGGRDWTLTIPPRVNHDPDILFCELAERYKSRIAELEAKSSPLEKSGWPNHHGLLSCCRYEYECHCVKPEQELRTAEEIHPDVVAWNKFKAENKETFHADTVANDRYLENRLWAAFFAGRDYAASQFKQIAVEPEKTEDQETLWKAVSNEINDEGLWLYEDWDGFKITPKGIAYLKEQFTLCRKGTVSSEGGSTPHHQKNKDQDHS